MYREENFSELQHIENLMEDVRQREKFLWFVFFCAMFLFCAMLYVCLLRSPWCFGYMILALQTEMVKHIRKQPTLVEYHDIYSCMKVLCRSRLRDILRAPVDRRRLQARQKELKAKLCVGI